ncbi:hypothetical protein VB264_19260 [Arcicella aquatica]|uniref:Tetratricopeptide repeat protein n=1 Tax=Arcicella aquatica TaxID=217141 RepID=A0ABU5QTB6_9BACT|nr:hypothetical protein [Arcicella aquatica]MEA5259945.1 hypothetical protein [Arcicella aquatica]
MKKILLFLSLAFLLNNHFSYSQSQSFQELMDLGVTQSRLGNHAAAQSYFSQAIAIKPDDAIAYYDRGVTKANLKDNRGAINDFGSPKNVMLYLSLS